MNILLADDENLVRLDLKIKLEELYPLNHTYYEVANGAQLLDYLTHNQPDIIFLDIHMPELNGLDALEHLQNKQIAVILLTGYAEFEYARRALTLGAVEYLLKPASLNDLARAMERAAAFSRQLQWQRLRDYQLECSKLFQLYQNINFILTPRLIIPPISLITFYFDTTEREVCQDFTKQILNLCQNLMKRRKRPGYYFYLNSGEACFFFGGILTEGEAKIILTAIRNRCTFLVTGFLSISQSIPEMFQNLEKVQRFSPLRICAHLGELFTSHMIAACQGLLPLAQKLDKFLMFFKESDSLASRQSVWDLLNDNNCRMLFKKADKACISSYLSTAARLNPDTSSFDSFCTNLLDLAYSNTPDKRASRSDIIAFIHTYINKNYMNQIGINTLAQLLDLSPNYLSKLYKTETGRNFIDDLATLRILQAKKLFEKTPNITVKAVAGQVGYFSTRYFTKLFLKHTSMLPSEYQKRYKYLNKK